MASVRTQLKRSVLHCPLCRADVAYDQALTVCHVCRASQHRACVHELGPCHAAPYRLDRPSWLRWAFGDDASVHSVLAVAAVILACLGLWVAGHAAFLAPAYLGFALASSSRFARSLLRGWHEEGFDAPALVEDATAFCALLALAALSVFSLFYL